MNIEVLLFYIFGSLALVSGGLVVSARNPMHSILYLVLFKYSVNHKKH